MKVKDAIVYEELLNKLDSKLHKLFTKKFTYLELVKILQWIDTGETLNDIINDVIEEKDGNYN